MLSNFAVLPPEVNSARVYAGSGPAPMLSAAAAWSDLAAELDSAALAFGSVTQGLVAGSWQGPASLAMAAATEPYVSWLATSAAHAQGAAALAQVAATEFEAALAATVPPAVVAANRIQAVSLVASNFFGQNAPAIAAIESVYEQMWAQDVSAMAAYHAGAALVAGELSGWQQRLQGLFSVAQLANTAGSGNGSTAANAAAAQTVAQVMGGSGTPIPSSAYLYRAASLYIERMVPGAIAQALFTPQGLYPVIAIKNLTFDNSVVQGLTILDTAIRQQIAAGNNVTVFGYSQSASMASLEMAKLAASPNPPRPDQLSFTLIGNPNNPNGGVAVRFPGISIPSIGVTATAATPSNLYPTNIYTLEYDGVADFPRYPLNVLSTLNAVAGAYYVHSNYFLLTPAQIDSAIPLTNTVGPTMTHYYVIPTKDLPLLQPLRSLPVIGDPIADLIQPDLRVLVNLGYGDPAYGYSTSPPNVPTPFGLFPEVNPLAVAHLLAAGTQQGIGDFVYDITHLELPEPPSLPDIATLLSPNPSPTPSSGAPPPFVIDGVIDDLQAASTHAADSLSKIAETGYATMLPTADLLNALLTTAPSYNLNLFLEGIRQAAHGDPMGLVNAVGYPLAADTALLSVAGALELLIFINASQAISASI
ncbi:PPE family protein [Mycobacterium angelicum]|uniref:PPE family protein n=1 Tax=Mycobacterium angelicum TaxID=470074 RepID=A0A1X0A7Y3_MYCAN|nr:PPE family protein [Mycobacterium angelicum]MCV7194951.1 PPE family protein [Mycobacterium angelicum]ORA25786.1 hypothetical protein BST12_01715 [Mycobacterium angelicum]